MPEYDDTEAPVTVSVDDPEAYSGHMDDRPVKVNVDTNSDHAERSHQPVGTAPDIQVSMSPAEAYHFADDLQAAADDCWGAAEYVVHAVTPSDYNDVYLTTIKAPSPDEAVKRAVDYVERAAEDDRERWGDVAQRAVMTDTFRVYRADSITTVQKQADDDSDN